MGNLKIDLHPVYNNGKAIESMLQEAFRDAVQYKYSYIEIIPGKGSGQLKKKVLKFLERKEIKALYHRIEKDPGNFGRLWVHFRH